jgi:hypothetical protein
MLTQTYLAIYLYIYLPIYLCMCSSARVCLGGIHVCVCVCVCVCASTCCENTHTHNLVVSTHTHTHTHTHTQSFHLSIQSAAYTNNHFPHAIGPASQSPTRVQARTCREGFGIRLCQRRCAHPTGLEGIRRRLHNRRGCHITCAMHKYRCI